MSNANGPFRCQGCGELIEWDPEARVYSRPDVVGRIVTVCDGNLQTGVHLPDGRGAVKATEPLGDSERDGTLGEVIDRRVQVYGDPVVGFSEIAAMWSVFLGHEIQAWEVPIMMALMKVVRMKSSPDYSDHSDDIEGYLDIFRKVIGPDMIEARSVNEYIEKKWGV